MALDTSIFQNSKVNPVVMPDAAQSMAKAMSIKQMAMQNQQSQIAMQQQQGVRQAYANNTGDNGQLNQQGFLSDLGKVSPQASMDYQEKFNKMNKDSADASSAQLDNVSKLTAQVLPSMTYLAGLPDDARAKAYPQVMGQLEQKGVPMQNVPKDASGNYLYDPGFFNMSYSTLKNTAENLSNMKSQSEVAKNYSEMGKAPAEINALNNGPRSPNAEITSQYQTDAKPLKGSQMPMNQMMDNYKNPSPQGDASLVLNAFKIKFPNAPDVNSLEELTHSQAASDTFKNAAAKALSGGLDQNTRDNLMRDGISTFRANYDSLQGVKDRYNARAAHAQVNDPTMTYEPAMDKTYNQAMATQDKIGPYVPPSDRGGISGTISKLASSVLGVGGNQTASASSDSAAPNVPDGFVLMQSPTGKMKVIPKAQYGEAIAAGGKVVK
jgi:hypothetical protein